MTSSFDLSRYQDAQTIQRVLHNSKTVAIVGLSKNELRASYFVGYYLSRHGYNVIPVNPRESSILGSGATTASSTCPSQLMSSTFSGRQMHSPESPGRPWRSAPRRCGVSSP